MDFGKWAKGIMPSKNITYRHGVFQSPIVLSGNPFDYALLGDDGI